MKLTFRTCVSFVLIFSLILYVLFDMKTDEAAVTSREIPLDLRFNDNEWDISKVDHKYNSSVKHIFYNMVPKCGSQSTRYVINNLSRTNTFYTTQGFTQPYITANYHLDRHSIKYTADKLLQMKEPWVFFKHLNYINFTSYGIKLDPVYINLIRDPIDRLESYYYYRRAINTKNKITYHGEIVEDFFRDSDDEDAHRRHNMPFDECVLTFDPECTDVRFIWTIIPHFCGQHYLCQTPTRHALNLAINNVLTGFAVVGHVTKYMEFLEVLETMLPHYFKGAVNAHMYLKESEKYRHTSGFKSPKMSAAARQMLMDDDIIKLEYEFYDFVTKRFKIVYESYMGRKLS